MLVVMKAHAGQAEIARVCERIESLGFKPHIIPGEQRTAIGITGNSGPVDAAEFEDLPGSRRGDSCFEDLQAGEPGNKARGYSGQIRNQAVGGTELVPCARVRVRWRAASRFSMRHARRRQAGAQLLRGGAYKPSTSPYSFQGLGGRRVTLSGRRDGKKPGSAS